MLKTSVPPRGIAIHGWMRAQEIDVLVYVYLWLVVVALFALVSRSTPIWAVPSAFNSNSLTSIRELDLALTLTFLLTFASIDRFKIPLGFAILPRSGEIDWSAIISIGILIDLQIALQRRESASSVFSLKFTLRFASKRPVSYLCTTINRSNDLPVWQNPRISSFCKSNIESSGK